MKNECEASPVIENTITVTERASELCVAVETLRIAYPAIFSTYVGKLLLQRRLDLLAILRTDDGLR